MRLRNVTILCACLVVLWQAPLAIACGFAEGTGWIVTFSQDAATAKYILVGKLTNAKKEPGEGSTDFVIEQVVKGEGDGIARGKVLRIPRYIDAADAKPIRHHLVFGDVVAGKPDLYRGVVSSPALVKYVRGLLRINAKDRVALMRYCFDYLDHEDQEVAKDAFREFIKSPDPDIRTVAQKLPPDKLRRWLQNENESPYRLRLFGYLLGNCGNAKDIVLLRKLLDKWVKEKDPVLQDGVLTGYTLLSPREGWAYTRDLLQEPKTDVRVRIEVLRVLRYFYTTHPGVVKEKDLLEGVGLLLGQNDMADLAIEYLRRWKCWKLTKPIFALWGKKDFEAPYIRRAIVRYALQCPDAKAARLVAKLRKAEDPLLKSAEEELKYLSGSQSE